MNRVEQILSKRLSDHAINGSVISGATEITLEFTKWKDDNYPDRYNQFFFKDIQIPTDGKTSEQLFNEWKNQTT